MWQNHALSGYDDEEDTDEEAADGSPSDESDDENPGMYASLVNYKSLVISDKS